MDLSRPRLHEWAAGLAGVVLIVSLFLGWYGSDARTASGWQSLAVTDVLLALAAVMAIGIPVLAAAGRSDATLIAFSSFATIAAIVAVLLALLAVLRPADAAVGGEAGREPGVFLALGATLAMLVATGLSIRDDRPRGRRGSAPPPPPPVRDLGVPDPSATRSQAGAPSARGGA